LVYGGVPTTLPLPPLEIDIGAYERTLIVEPLIDPVPPPWAPACDGGPGRALDVYWTETVEFQKCALRNTTDRHKGGPVRGA
jgi:hypothetical protein